MRSSVVILDWLATVVALVVEPVEECGVVVGAVCGAVCELAAQVFDGSVDSLLAELLDDSPVLRRLEEDVGECAKGLLTDFCLTRTRGGGGINIFLYS